jgi:hypothetical protein
MIIHTSTAMDYQLGYNGKREQAVPKSQSSWETRRFLAEQARLTNRLKHATVLPVLYVTQPKSRP